MTDTRAERAREVMPEDIALLIAKHYAATPDTRRMLQSDIYKALTAFAADEVALALELLCDELELSMPDNPAEFNAENIWRAVTKAKAALSKAGARHD